MYFDKKTSEILGGNSSHESHSLRRIAFLNSIATIGFKSVLILAVFLPLLWYSKTFFERFSEFNARFQQRKATVENLRGQIRILSVRNAFLRKTCVRGTEEPMRFLDEFQVLLIEELRILTQSACALHESLKESNQGKALM